MSRIREGTRQVTAWLHGWVGLLLGWLLFAMCLAGTLSVFRPEISRWARPEVTAFADPADATARAAAWLGRHAATAPAWYILPSTDRVNTVDAAWFDGTGFTRRALDPITGAPVPRDTLGGEFFYRLHFELQLPYPWGRLLASLAGMALLVALVTGIVTHARFFRDFFTFRPGKGRRSWLDAHNALGVLSLPFHLMITVTGLLTLATVSMPWGIVANYGTDTQRLFTELAPGGVERAATGHRVPLAPLGPVFRDAERRFDGAGLGNVTIQNPGDAAATVTVARTDRDDPDRLTRQLVYDGASGRLLSDWHEGGRPVVSIWNTLYGLHLAHFAGTLVRWLYLIGGAMLTACVATGLILWTSIRLARTPLSRNAQLVERLNVGVIAGTLLTFDAFFLANRLIPTATPARESLEVSAVFWTGGAALVASLVLSPRVGWPLLLGITSAGVAAIPLIDLIDTALPAALARGDLAVAGVDLVALVVAAGFAHAARRAWKPVVREPVRRREHELVAAR